MSLVSLLMPNGRSGFGYGSTAEQVTAGLDLSGRTMLVTGCNSGLGYETALVLANRGARIIGTSRTATKAQAACEAFGNNALGLECELANPASVRACVAAIKAAGLKLDAIIANAGIMALPRLAQACGYELQFFTNHIGHFILVTGLLDDLTDNGRVVMLSSSAHFMAPRGGIEFDNLTGEKRYNDWRNYGQSKLANLLFAKELARRLKGTGKTANAVHPGVISTNLGRSMPWIMRVGLTLLSPIMFKNVEQGAATQCYVATNPALSGVSGEYFADCNVATPSAYARDSALSERLWVESERIVAGL